MMLKNENGLIFQTVLIFTSLLFLYVLGSIGYFLSYRQIPLHEMNKLQAGWNAEAGIWLAVHDWKMNQAPVKGQTYPLSRGSVVVSDGLISETQLKIESIGKVLPDYKAQIVAVYDLEKQQMTSWDREPLVTDW